MSFLLVVAAAIHTWVIVAGLRFLMADNFARDEHGHFAASISAASTFFLIAHVINYQSNTPPDVLWYGFSIFNGQLYLSLLRHYRNQRSALT